MTINSEQMKKKQMAQAEAHHHAMNSTVDGMKSWRSASVEAEDKAALAKDKDDLSSMENKRMLFGGADNNHGYMGAGVTDQDLKEKRDRIGRREADEDMYARDKK